MTIVSDEIGKIARARIATTEDQILRSISCIQGGLSTLCEDRDSRILASLTRNSGMDSQTALAYLTSLNDRVATPESMYGNDDFVPVSFMQQGLNVSRSTGRIIDRFGTALGSSFLCSHRLLITNHHVIASPSAAKAHLVEFNYEIDFDGAARPTSVFELAPEDFFFTDKTTGLDVTIVALGKRVRGAQEIEEFGWCGLSASSLKHAKGDYVSIIQHPKGRYKQVVLRENRIAGRHELVLHYITDTQVGSSGSAVYNSKWEVVALHHWGGTKIWKGDKSYSFNTVNEGIRISAILAKLATVMPSMPAAQLALAEDMLLKGQQIPFSEAISNGKSNHLPSSSHMSSSNQWQTKPRSNSSGGMTWTVPVEISVNLPSLNSAQALNSVASNSPQSAQTNILNSPKMASESIPTGRTGYRPDFVDGFVIGLPKIADDEQINIARIKPDQLEMGQNNTELRYEHFSILVNGARSMAYFSAVNIHGNNLRGYVRTKDKIYEYDDSDFPENAEGAERVGWRLDRRIMSASQTSRGFYKQNPNYLVDPKHHKNLKSEINFERGHLVRRLDPCWGNDRQLILAEGDSFHYTNAAPQTTEFNQGKGAGIVSPSESRLWAGIENYILRNALADGIKISVFTGCVFDGGDPVYASYDKKIEVQIPMKFWKVLFWQEAGQLKSLAIIADQTATMTNIPTSGQENISDEDQLAIISGFTTKIKTIEQLTGLDFGDELTKADIRKFKQNDGDLQDLKVN
ncbi:MAG: DNA/RNA non-specific endonuclease [Rhizobiales bacterium]|nr:DNA/RNA non-specific endonuclease [Hyphomicrobiales bacterium]NRB14383.1 DNA/RNA non-specific endonuclease [Hyphomicrobiales bacterium]